MAAGAYYNNALRIVRYVFATGQISPKNDL